MLLENTMNKLSLLVRTSIIIFLFWFLWFLFEKRIPSIIFGYGILIHSIVIIIISAFIIKSNTLVFKSRIYFSLGYFFLGLSDLFWGINYFIKINGTQSFLAASVSLLVSVSFFCFSLGFITSCKNIIAFFEKKITLMSFLICSILLANIIIYPFYINNKDLSSNLFGIIEIISIISSFFLLNISIITLFTTRSINWSVISSGISSLVIGDLSIRVEKVISDTISFDIYSVLFSFGLYSSTLPFILKYKIKPISKINYQSLFVNYKIGSLLIVFFCLNGFLYSQFSNLNSLRLSILFFCISTYLISFFSYYIVLKIKNLSIILSSIIHRKVYNEKPRFKPKSLPYELKKHYNYFLATSIRDQNNKILKEKLKTKNRTLKQVAHNIISPLLTLKFQLNELKIKNIDNFIIINKSLQNTLDIAYSLLRNNNMNQEQNNSTEKLLLVNLIDIIISQKRIEYKSFNDIKIIEKYDEKLIFSFVKVNEFQFFSVISNIINNSVQAINKKGEISIFLSENYGTIVLSIHDNGCGIPSSILKDIGTFGVTNKKEGSGIGLYHAKKYLCSIGGDFKIESNQNIGTKVYLELNSCSPPEWFVPFIEIEHKTIIVILDDNEMIHEFWKNRFIKSDYISTLHYYNTKDFFDWFSYKKNDNYIFFIDYELNDSEYTGVDLIKKAKINSSSYLVTSYISEKKIRELCLKENIKIIPKTYINYFPILIHENKQDFSEIYDAILIDDNITVINYWHEIANEKKKKILSFNSLIDFYININSINRKSPIYIDSELEHGIRGELAASKIKRIYKFEFIYLCTAQVEINKKQYPWINEVISKEPIW